jgi:hypothetical protein
MTLEDVEALGIGPYVVSIVASFVFTYALAWLLIATHTQGTRPAVKVAFIAWAAFIVPVVVSANAFRGLPWQLSALELACQGVNFLVSAAVLGSWRRRS